MRLSLAEQEIEGESLRGRRRGRARGCGGRVLAGRRRRRTVISLAQRRARCISRRRSEPRTRRRVERTFAPACRKPKRRHHSGHQGQPAPSIDGLFHWHPTCPQDCVTAATRAHHTRSAAPFEPFLCETTNPSVFSFFFLSPPPHNPLPSPPRAL